MSFRCKSEAKICISMSYTTHISFKFIEAVLLCKFYSYHTQYTHLTMKVEYFANIYILHSYIYRGVSRIFHHGQNSFLGEQKYFHQGEKHTQRARQKFLPVGHKRRTRGGIEYLIAPYARHENFSSGVETYYFEFDQGHT